MALSQVCRPLLVFSIFSNLLMLAAPLHMLQIYDRVLSSGSAETLIYISLIAAVALTLFGICEMIRARIAQRLSTQFTVKHADALFAGMTGGAVPVEKSNEIMRSFNTVRTFLASRSLISLYDVPFSPFFLLLLYLLNFQVGLLTTIGAGVLIAVAWLNKKLTKDSQKKASQTGTEAIAFASAIASRSEDIRAMGLLPALVDRWGNMMGAAINAEDASVKQSSFFMALSKSTRQILQITIMAWGAWLVLNGDMSGGMIFAASMISGKVLQPIEQMIGSWDGINRAQSAYTDLEKVLYGQENKIEKITQPDPSGHLTISNVSLTLDGQDKSLDILKDINFKVSPGELLAIIGPSGSGKSTLARIIAGAASPSTGEVMLDGCVQKNWPTEQWGRWVGYVGQEILLFPGTVAENISRMSSDENEAQIIKAAQLAGAHNLINSFPDGYMTKIGGDGVRLSGGQKQRIALARALYSSPKLLILDEPNAHLDQEGENILMKSLNRLKKSGVAIIIVTQRRSILKTANRIMMIKEGRQVPLNANSERPKPKTTANAGEPAPYSSIARPYPYRSPKSA
ncbi:type I secretion system permease/ATPase [Lentilitoribacter sp. Alg239-R112]|uniref:type I secretion system permease/ATPase n=1 Tax=Lentilitoribacter sp. Alg239-R112 TaxID=2305987 RepID=UPI0021109B1E|nr:type I secretion system permease/ATPase [Lentilitoribacter sp. Alg239-R112]